MQATGGIPAQSSLPQKTTQHLPILQLLPTTGTGQEMEWNGHKLNAVHDYGSFLSTISSPASLPSLKSPTVHPPLTLSSSKSPLLKLE